MSLASTSPDPVCPYPAWNTRVLTTGTTEARSSDYFFTTRQDKLAVSSRGSTQLDLLCFAREALDPYYWTTVSTRQWQRWFNHILNNPVPLQCFKQGMGLPRAWCLRNLSPASMATPNNKGAAITEWLQESLVLRRTGGLLLPRLSRMPLLLHRASTRTVNGNNIPPIELRPPRQCLRCRASIPTMASGAVHAITKTRPYRTCRSQ